MNKQVAAIGACLVAVILLVVTLLASSSFVEQRPKTVITLWEYPRWKTDNDRFGWINAQIKEFENKHPDVEIKLTPCRGRAGSRKSASRSRGISIPTSPRGTSRR